MTRMIDIAGWEALKAQGLKKMLPDKPRIAVGMGTCGIGNGANDVFEAFGRALDPSDALLTKTGCFGFCAQEPLVNVHIPGHAMVILHRVAPEDVKAIVADIRRGRVPVKKALCQIKAWDFITGQLVFGEEVEGVPLWNEVPFFKWQKKIVLRDCGLINPEDIEEYIAIGGYGALAKVLRENAPDRVIEEVRKSNLRGRGGAGFPTGVKWLLMRQETADQKHVICNADEGDPGAFMNRNEIESDPHMILEGMLIGAFAMGAGQGTVYIRAEYPLAVERLQRAILSARAQGLLGQNILGSGFSFDITLVEGAGAFVCGEETALIASIEGQAGRPRPRPPFPAQRGLNGKPTNINNVETWANIPAIIARGGAWFTETGTAKSAGTKVFSLVGKIKNTGLVELPLGSAIKTIVYNIGGGTGTRKRVKSIQTGGPSGGCIPVSLFDTPVDYESLNALGAIMGSGGMVVMDDDNCMVDVARYFTEFTTNESCGKCTPCREGLFQALKILKRISAGLGTPQDIEDLKTLGAVIKDTALCGLGQTGPNPVLTTLKYFQNEYEGHIAGHRCDAGVCAPLFVSPCENSCPLHMNIPGFLTLVKEEKLADAFDAVLRDNFLPASSGRICHFHCKMRCRREDIDDPVSQGEVHRYIADTLYAAKKEKPILERIKKEVLPATRKRVSIIGAGPAGLTAAFYLKRLGHDVVVYEAQSEPGGVLRYGIPSYRLPKDILAKEIKFVEKLGVRFHFNKRVDAEDFRAIESASDAVFVATGAYKNMPLGIPGDNLKGVISGTAFLEDVAVGRKTSLGKNVLIVGAGNVAVDAARTAWRLGAQVTIVYRRQKPDMPANKDEIREAEREGIRFVFLAAPKAVLADEQGRVRALQVARMTPGEYDVSGRQKPVMTDQIYDIPCDTVMAAIGERVDAGFLKACDVALRESGTVKVDAVTFGTNRPKVYAGGDLVMGPATAVEAMAQGKEAAQHIDAMLMGQDRFGKLFRKYDYENAVPEHPANVKHQAGRLLDPAQRRKNFKEVSLGLSRQQVSREACRCLRCDVKEGAVNST